METQRICPSCQKPLPPDVPLGLCPECLIKSGFNTGTEPGNPGRESSFVPPPVEELRKLFPQLEILELIGKGGMGAVYKARQPALDRLVALKILPPGAADDAGFAERFNREARALARLNHPHIVAVHDFGQVSRQPYLVMELVEGPNLRQVEQAGRLTPEQALEIVPQICEALQFAHNEGVVHRDIKPENILLDKKGRVKITDFGIAKIVGVPQGKVALTGAKDVLGTPHYMAPEQVEKPSTVDHRADIYSLGVVFYELLTGELPLGKFQPPSKKVQVDVRLDEVVLHTLEKEPERRYQQASQVKTDVETITATPSAGSSGHESVPSEDQSWLTSAATIHSMVKAPANWLVATGILNWIAIPLIIFATMGIVAGKGGTVAALPTLLIPLSVMILSSATILAGFKMKRLEAYSLAIIGSILAILVTPGNIIGLPVGIWSLVVLCRREVREAFGKGYWPPRDMPAIAAPTARLSDRFWRRFAVAVVLGLLALMLIPVGAILLGIALPALTRTKHGPNLTLSGTVSDAATGRPIAGARVDDTRYGPNRIPQQAWTDANGRYELQTWYEEHTLSASAPGYEPNLQTLITKPFGKEKTAQMDFTLKAVSKDEGPSFGPAIERVIAGEGDANRRFVDFDTGKLFAAAEFFGPKAEPSPEETQTWWRQNGMDAVCDTSPTVRGLIGFEMVAAPVPSEEWDRLPPTRLDYYFTLGEPGTPAMLSGKGVLPATFAIKTREGGKGLLQITEITDQPPGVKVRYKLLNTAPPRAPQSALPAPRHFVRLVVDKTAMTFEGQPTTWEAVPALLERVPDRTNTVLELAVTSDQITVAQQNEWFQKAVVLAREFQFAYASFIGIHPLGSKGTTTSQNAAESPSEGSPARTSKSAMRDGVNFSAKGDRVVVESPEGFRLTANSVKFGTNGTLVAEGNVAGQTRNLELPDATDVFTVLTNGQGTHVSIQAAIDAAAPHTIIRIGPGRFEESLVIGKTVTLEGEGWDKTVIGPTKPWVEPPPGVQREAERRWRDAKTDEARRQLREEFTVKFSRPVLRIQGANGDPDKAERYRRAVAEWETLRRREQELLTRFTGEHPFARRIHEELQAAETHRRQLEAEARVLPGTASPGTTASRVSKTVQVTGLRFTLPGPAPDGKLLPTSVIEVRDAELVMRDCAIIGSPGNGLVLEGDSRAQISKTLVVAVWNTGIVIRDTAGAGIFDSDIRNCHYAGITIGRGLEHVTIKGCRISGAAWHGIRYDDAGPKILENLIFANARCGIYASGKTAALVGGNVFWKNEMNGMSCWFENRDRITNNTFAANLREGLSVLGASEPVVERNIFWRNPQGVQQGNVSGIAANTKATAKLNLRENLFWTNAVNVISSVGQREGETNAPAKLSLADFPGNLEADPGFRDAGGGDFTLLPDGAAAKAGIGATGLRVTSPWPLQPEEKAIIPDGDTRDSRQWKRSGDR